MDQIKARDFAHELMLALAQSGSLSLRGSASAGATQDATYLQTVLKGLVEVYESLPPNPKSGER